MKMKEAAKKALLKVEALAKIQKEDDAEKRAAVAAVDLRKAEEAEALRHSERAKAKPTLWERFKKWF